ATPLLLGTVVHDVLEALVKAAGGAVNGGLDAVREHEPVRVPWPDESELRRLLQRSAAKAAQDQGVVLPGFAELLERRVRPFLEAFKRLEWADGPLEGVLGAELRGEVDLAAHDLGEGRVRFKADRVDQRTGLSLVDYKTGKPVSDKVKPSTRREHLLDQVRARKKLQAAVYAFSAPDAVGRYVFGGPDLEPQLAHVSVAPDDAELREALRQALELGLGAWAAGVFPPRLFDPEADRLNRSCERCQVADACARGDSSQHQRMRRWLDAEGIETRSGPDAFAAALLEERS
ncbi:MAG: PD-(D/E)XK nuclease family protein, partial [Myxococcota bacterium]|nr:PD-(D/E)XK nuclease family protein [Myxococcota bacterium]